MELTEQHILIDTNILLTTLRDEDYFLEPQRELLMTHLHDLHEENTFYMTDIIKYEYIKNAKKYLLKKKKMREKIQKRVDKVILCYENKEKILKNDVENLEENMLDLDEQL